MNRIFAMLCVVAVTLLAITLYLGLTAGDYNEISQQYRAAQRQAANGTESRPSEVGERIAEVTDRLESIQSKHGQHTRFGLLSTLVTVMVNSLAVTYFIGTGRWCKEVTETYRLDEKFDNCASRLKRTTFPWSIVGISTVLLVAALGAASDPGTLRETTANWVLPHYFAAMIGIGIIAYAFYRQYEGICQNQQNIAAIMESVRSIRAERGLDAEPVAVS